MAQHANLAAGDRSPDRHAHRLIALASSMLYRTAITKLERRFSDRLRVLQQARTGNHPITIFSGDME